MKFETRDDIEAPIDHVFAQLSDFAAHERSLMRRGADVERVEDRQPPAPGIVWDTAFDLRGKRRRMRLELVDYAPPSAMGFVATSETLNGDMLVDLVALARGRTRMTLVVELKPKTLSARLLVQSLKLARGNVSKRYEMRVSAFARELEDRYARRA